MIFHGKSFGGCIAKILLPMLLGSGRDPALRREHSLSNTKNIG